MAQRNAYHIVQAGAKYRDIYGGFGSLNGVLQGKELRSMSWDYRLTSWPALLPEDIQDLQGGALDLNPNSRVSMVPLSLTIIRMLGISLHFPRNVVFLSLKWRE